MALAVLASGCGGDQSATAPDSTATHEISDLWWAMLGMGVVVFLGTAVFLVGGWVRRHKEGLPIFGQDEKASTWLVVAFGIVIPILVLVPVFVAANLFITEKTSAPAKASTPMTIQVIGHQWWWEVRYPGTTAVTANEIHIPTNTRIDMIATTADVIHSFWVPRINRKIDMIPGKTNRILFDAEKPGVYRGQCAEFCGAQHAHMSLKVFAESPSRFRAWLHNMSSSAPTPTTAEERSGEHAFMADQCASCHTIRGTSAQGKIGPDLTHLATRSTLAALTIPNDRGHLAGWILDPQHVKPGNDMPGLGVDGPDLHALLAYLDSLK